MPASTPDGRAWRVRTAATSSASRSSSTRDMTARMTSDTEGVTRRTFLRSAAGAAALAAAPLSKVAGVSTRALAQGAPVAPPEIATTGRPQGTEKFGASVDNIPIIDAHIHLFDGTRPQGASYMGSAAYREKSKTSLPGLYKPLATPSGVVGAIVVESSAWVEDNLWYLEVSQADPFIVGVSGRLDPYKPEFGEYLERYHKNPLYGAIRASRFYTNTDGRVTLDPVAVENLKLLAQADLAQDTANPSMPLMTANVMLADAIPNLRIIMDHLPSFDPTPDGQA